jgi:hypothetical protein
MLEIQKIQASIQTQKEVHLEPQAMVRETLHLIMAIIPLEVAKPRPIKALVIVL